MTMGKSRWGGLGLFAVLLVLAGCGDPDDNMRSGDPSSDSVASDSVGSDSLIPSTTPPGEPVEQLGDGDLPFGLARCGEFEVISADPTFYRDEPVYVGNEMPIDDVRAWAVDQPGYEDIWIDRDHRGWIAVGFRSDTAQRQTELEAEFPGVGVVAVQIEHGQDELEQLLREVFAVMQANGMDRNGGVSVPSGQVSVFVGVLDEATLEPFAEFAGRPVCFEGVDPADAVIDGPQPTSGEGWRLLAVERTGESYRTGVATTEDQYAALWEQSGVTAAPPPVDFGDEIVIWFGAVYGSGCEIRMDDVIIDLDRAIVHGEFVIPGNPGACNDDANPEAYLVAVDRARLPEGPFAIQLHATDPPAGVPEERTMVTVDLSAPGSTAADDQIGTDPALFDAADEGYAIEAGGIVEPGFPANYRLDLDCNFEVIGPINGVVWSAEAAGISSPVNRAWINAGDADGTLLVEILLIENPPRVTLTANGHTESYGPAPRGATSDCP
jgi:hypothetical protein